ncbi:imidazoleglycerol-phosphate dehydratase HisB [Ruminiclostridium herbifermentans]|uniref:Imidazoleglycerol-phosphate dehydratase n=1 Tax=Ruminiclostridium herbifermentans TaxID=2488810 RepID=A0A4U7JFV9_9FIRM|nr:imidazoleglycerol-phosphate dehydratase HisB [Ruminiclostridium herbifermentans]QNU67585.1 imidazoleglycerol-phosphate dehydratase HisB [Ruminiclostridium herbifermentans]
MREGLVNRNTKETQIKLKINLDGKGDCNCNSGIGFFDHMLVLFTKHGLMDADFDVKGDLEVDAHHTVEDTGIALGLAIRQALGDKKSIKRYGTAFVPMDESLVQVSLDLSDRPFLVFDAEFSQQMVGQMDTQLVEEFFRAVAFNAGITLHIKLLHGTNCHHIIEAMFKAFGRALDEATKIDTRIVGVMSTKGML